MLQKVTTELENELLRHAKEDNITRVVVGAIIGRHEKNALEILVLERVSTDFMGGIDELPSGKVEVHETPLQALRREILEETNLEVDEIVGYVFSFDYLSSSQKLTRQFNFAVRMKEGKVRVSPNEHGGYRWLTKPQIMKSKLTDNIKRAILQNWEDLGSRQAGAGNSRNQKASHFRKEMTHTTTTLGGPKFRYTELRHEFFNEILLHESCN